MMDEVETTKQVRSQMERTAALRAREIAKAARWDIDVAVFFFAVLSITIILLFQEVEIGIVASTAAIGLAMGWFMGWRKGERIYKRLYDEELSKLEQDLKRAVEEAVEETIEEKIQKALRERLR